jgi:hypothetical protein
LVVHISKALEEVAVVFPEEGVFGFFEEVEGAGFEDVEDARGGLAAFEEIGVEKADGGGAAEAEDFGGLAGLDFVWAREFADDVADAGEVAGRGGFRFFGR